MVKEFMAPRTGLDSNSLDVLFRKARTHRSWLPILVPDELLREMYDLFKLGPTSSNTCPARFLFIKSEKAKARLIPTLSAGNVEKTKAAPVTAVIAYDTRFFEMLPKLSPGGDPKIFSENPKLAEETAFRNGSLQGAYLIMAARALGLDCGPMSGFDADKLNAEFFPDGRWKANFLCNLAYGDPEKLRPRQPRLDFDEACRIL
jgi:3-hydroxypropanoate dehydrogenase